MICFHSDKEIIYIKDVKVLLINYERAIPIRQKVLWPDKKLEFCYVEGDLNALHFAAFLNSEIICVASIYIDGSQARLRKFATLKNHQRKGVGTTVLFFILKFIKEKGMTYFWCDARTSAIGFYKKFGLQPEGGEFFKYQISYYKMSMRLCL